MNSASASIDLTEAETRDLIALIQAGRPLPDTLTTARHTDPRAGRYTAAVKVIDIFGNDTMTLLPVSVG